MSLAYVSSSIHAVGVFGIYIFDSDGQPVGCVPLVGADVGLSSFHFHKALLEVKHLHAMVASLYAVCQKFG